MVISTINLFNILPYEHDGVRFTYNHVCSLYLKNDIDLQEMVPMSEKAFIKYLKKGGFNMVNERFSDKFLRKFCGSYLKEQCLSTSQADFPFTKKLTGAQLITLLE